MLNPETNTGIRGRIIDKGLFSILMSSGGMSIPLRTGKFKPFQADVFANPEILS